MKEALQEEYREFDHWFFRARREIFGRVLDERVTLPAGARILDVGPGSGVNVPVLRERGRLTVLDVAATSLRDCAEKGAHELVRADAVRLPFADGTFDLVCLLDVLEHLRDDHAALGEYARVLKPGGTLFLSVPALQLLWGRQDVLSEHYRRYRRAPLATLLDRGGFEVEHLTYFNTWLFGPILAVRLLMRPFLARSVRAGSDFTTPTPFGADELLRRLFASEGGWVARRRLPIGVSLLALAHPRPRT